MYTSAQEQPEQKRLKVHEWLAIVTFIGCLTILTLLAYFPSSPSQIIDAPHYLGPSEIEVFVEGAVEHPGIYRVKPGAILQEILFLAQPTAAADLRRLKLDSKLRQGRVIKIPLKKKARQRRESGDRSQESGEGN